VYPVSHGRGDPRIHRGHVQAKEFNMPKYHYNVHVISQTPGLDFTMWVGVTLDHRVYPEESTCLDGSPLGQAAMARARELCPALKECFCEEWNGGEEVSDDHAQKFKMILSYEAVVELEVEAKDAEAAYDIARGHLLDTRHDDITYSQEPSYIDMIDP
jgi:hypothetical protein